MTTAQAPAWFYRVRGDRMCVHHHATAAAARRCSIGDSFGLLNRPGEPLRPGESDLSHLFGRNGVYGWPGGPFVPAGSNT